jgi:hypothetical protein
MTLAQMLADLNARIGSSPEVSNAQMTYWLNQGLRTFCEENDFSWLEKKQIASAVSGQSDYALPSDFKRLVELQIDSTPYAYSSHEFRVLRSSSDKFFSIFGPTMTISPTPTATGSGNMELWYIKRPANLVNDSDSPSDTTIASMPEAYHEALILYAFAIYNAYDEEQAENQALMGSKTNPLPGTFYYFVKLAKDADSTIKKAQRSRMLSRQEFIGYSYPNRSPISNTVLGN